LTKKLNVSGLQKISGNSCYKILHGHGRKIKSNFLFTPFTKTPKNKTLILALFQLESVAHFTPEYSVLFFIGLVKHLLMFIMNFLVKFASRSDCIVFPLYVAGFSGNPSKFQVNTKSPAGINE